MRKMSPNGLLLCRIQAELFSHYGEFLPCSPLIFVRRFMFSSLAKRFDDMTVLLEVSTNKTFIDEINEEYGQTSFGKFKDEDKERMYWVGYVYRYWAYTYEISSHDLFLKVPVRFIYDRYDLYHSMDVEYVIQRIMEEEHIYFDIKKTLEELLSKYMHD